MAFTKLSTSFRADRLALFLGVYEQIAPVSLRFVAAIDRPLEGSQVGLSHAAAHVTDTNGLGPAARALVVVSTRLLDQHMDRLQAVARLHPDAPIVFGGPQASVVDLQTLETFPWVDMIVRGEAEWTFPTLLDALEGSAADVLDFDRLPGITYREDGKILRSPNAPLISDLDALPLPAFELDPNIEKRRSAHLELGRGCPYGCTFCSTNDFFRRKFRLKSSHVLLAQMRELNARYGVTAFTLVHDMYTVNRDRMVEFCELLLAAGEQYEWSCSARTDRVDRELLTLMARAGCVGIFFGVETGSAEMQRNIKKRLDLDQAWESVRAATDNGMKTAVALIAGFPEETRDDLRATVHFFIRSTRLDHAEPQMSLLAPLAETPIEKAYRGRLVFDHIYSDMSYQGWREDPDDLELIERHVRRGSAGSPTAGSPARIAGSAAAPGREPAGVPSAPTGRSTGGAPCAGASRGGSWA